MESVVAMATTACRLDSGSGEGGREGERERDERREELLKLLT